MVFIPWSEMGICKHWMLRRCHKGSDCSWRHPEPKERQWLWDYHTEKQQIDEAQGISPPMPSSVGGDRRLDGRDGRMSDVARQRRPTALHRDRWERADRHRDPAPPPPPPPPPAPPSRWDRAPSVESRYSYPSEARERRKKPALPHAHSTWHPDERDEWRVPSYQSYTPAAIRPRDTATQTADIRQSRELRRADAALPVYLAERPDFITRDWPHRHAFAEDERRSTRTVWWEELRKGDQGSGYGREPSHPHEPNHDRKDSPWTDRVPPEMDRGSTQSAEHDVSMLDAPPSPKNERKQRGYWPAGNANIEPLGRPNRLLDTKSDGNDATMRMGDKDAGDLHETMAAKTELQEKVKEDSVTAASETGIPTIAATTLWRRDNAAVNADVSDMLKQEKHGEVVDGQHSPSSNSRQESEVTKLPATKSWDNIQHQHLTQQGPYISSATTTPPSSLPVPPNPPNMGATKRMSNGEAKHVGPHPSTIRVSAPYMSQSAISKRLQQSSAQSSALDLQERSIAEAREDTIRLQGITWIDNVRRSLQLPIRTYTTACVYFHKFRLAHAGSLTGMEYGNAWADACAASLLTSCKVEDTLKKSRDILAAAWNLKNTTHDQLGADDTVFEAPSRAVIGLERLVLEAGGFDFRSKYPHRLLVKLAKSMPEGVDGERDQVAKVAWSVLTDLYRTFAPLKQSTATMALASLELAAHLVAAGTPGNVSAVRDAMQSPDLKTWSTTREEMMETLLDLLDLYTQHTATTILGTKYSLDDFLRVRLALNKECNEFNIPRYTTAPPSEDRPSNGNTTSSTLRVANGHPTPVSPMEPGPQVPAQTQNANGTHITPEGGGTLRFMLDPQLATDEKTQVQKFFVEEWEEYEEEVIIPQPAAVVQPLRATSRDRDRDLQHNSSNRNTPVRNDRAPLPPLGGRGDDRARSGEARDRLADRDREAERDRARGRGMDRDGRRFQPPPPPPPPADRRFEDWDRDRRYDDRRPRERYEDRRFEEDRRRRDERR